MPVLGALFAAAALLYAGHRSAVARRPADPLPALRPGRIDWGRALANVWTEQSRDHISVMAAGVAFYGLLSIFPAMSVLISIYGLIADPIVIEQQVSGLAGVLPHDALKLLSDQLQSLIAAPPTKLGLGVVIGLLITMWSAASAAGTMMQALTVAYESEDDRGVLAFYARALALTLAMILFGVASLFLIAVVPAVLNGLPFPPLWGRIVALVRWPLLVVLVFIALAFLYRFAPARKNPKWHWFGPGTIAAAVLWLVGSAGFSIYVSQFSSYNKTYGSIGAVVILLMWFYVSAYIILAGAELNAEIEKQQGPAREAAPEAQPAVPR